MKKHKNLFIAAAVFALAAVYIYAFFLSGVWKGDAFLYKKDGKFRGSDKYAEYIMSVDKTSDGAKIEFSLDGEKHSYEVIAAEKPNEKSHAEIYENGKNIFSGDVLEIDGTYILTNADGTMDGFGVKVGSEAPAKEDLLPSLTELYRWSQSKTDFRGNPFPAIVLLFAGLILFLDIKFPRLFFFLRHGLEVDGGEPSDWYLFGQQAGRILLGITVITCVILTFTLH